MNGNLSGKHLKKRVLRRLDNLPVFHDWLLKRRFRVEIALLNGRIPPHHSSTTHRSIIHFSVNKAATQYVKRILTRCAAHHLTPVCMSEYAWHTGFPYLFTLSNDEVRPYLHIFRPHGYLYSTFGGLIEGIADIDDYLVVIVLRDPRDVLVSGYYSYAFSHALPQADLHRQAFTDYRDRTRSLSLDEYAIHACAGTRQQYERYLTFADQHPGAYLTRYEEMLTDFPRWLDNLLAYCQLSITPALRQRLLAEAQAARQQKEDLSRHRRQATPGEHGRKLQPATITYLNDHLADVLAKLNS
jgi:hypothetical protein